MKRHIAAVLMTLPAVCFGQVQWGTPTSKIYDQFGANQIHVEQFRLTNRTTGDTKDCVAVMATPTAAIPTVAIPPGITAPAVASTEQTKLEDVAVSCRWLPKPGSLEWYFRELDITRLNGLLPVLMQAFQVQISISTK